METYRQGELLFIKVEKKIPDWVKEDINEGKDLGNNIREGEVSGHIHETDTGTLTELTQNTWYNYNAESESRNFQIPRGEMFLTSDNQIKVKHPEHDTLALPKGDYVIRIQREYDDADKWRYVND